MKQTIQSTNGQQQSELRFILVNGLLKKGMFFAVLWFLVSYLVHFDSLDFWGLVYYSIITGAVIGLGTGLTGWHRTK